MKKPCMQRLCSLLILVMLLSGCFAMTRVVEPDKKSTNDVQREASHLKDLKISYHVTVLGRQSDKIATQALKDSLSEIGVEDVIDSDILLPNRTHVVVFILAPQLSATARHTPWLPWMFLSQLTLTLLPNYEGNIHPVEIQVVDPSQPSDKQFKIVASEYETSTIQWLPFGFMLNRHTDEDKVYFNSLSNSEAKLRKLDNLNYVGYRRIFDNALRTVLYEKK